MARPVMFLPGRAKLSTVPAATGSTTLTITIGIVVVACLAARITGGRSDNDSINVEPHELGDKIRHTFLLALSVTIFEHDVFPVNVAEIT